ncbi:MAG: GNAT family N-acetyltransferase [Firmicutes bacterium]|nr:GNAT family N-acetyltransferase [Bacillota bacterium]
MYWEQIYEEAKSKPAAKSAVAGGNNDVKKIIKALPAAEKKMLGPRWFFDESQYRYIHKVNGQLAGFIESRNTRNNGHLHLAVHPDYRGKKIANKMVKKAIKEIPQQFPEVKKIYWVTDANNKASIYMAQKHGFTQTSKRNGEIRYVLDVNTNQKPKGVKENMNGILEALGQLTRLQEAGRTVSKANEAKIKAAIQALQDIINKLNAGSTVSESEQREAVEEAVCLVEAERTHSEIRSILRAALKTMYNDKYGPFIMDTADSFVIYERDNPSDNKIYKVNYTIDDNNKVTFGDPVQVIRKTIWEQVQQPTRTTESQTGTETEISGEFIPLVEKGVRRDGTIPIKVIGPGWGNSGYYSKDVLKQDAGVYKAGTKMYWDHPTKSEESERPERSLRDMAAVLVSDGRFEENGADGPGVYADAKVFGPYQEALSELAPHIGVSHRALGKAKVGEVEGKTGPIIEKVVAAESVDFVTTPGAGGKVLELFEAARGGNKLNQQFKEGDGNVSDQELKELREAKTKLEEDNKRLQESLILRESRDFVLGELMDSKLPDITKQRLVESLANSPALDKDEFKKKIKEAVDAEIDYLAKVTGSGEIRGMGEGGNGGGEVNMEEAQKTLESSFSRLGLSESAAKNAARGREV